MKRRRNERPDLRASNAHLQWRRRLDHLRRMIAALREFVDDIYVSRVERIGGRR